MASNAFDAMRQRTRRFGSGVGFEELLPPAETPVTASVGAGPSASGSFSTAPAPSRVVRSEPIAPTAAPAPSTTAPAVQSAPPGARGGSRSWRNNNPGNIEYGPYARSMGATGSDGRFAIFPDYQSGRSAQEKLLFDSKGYRDLTLGQAIQRWAPASENNVPAYIRAMGGDAGKRMSEYTPEERARLLNAMQRHEGWRPGVGAPEPTRYADAGADAARVEREGGPRMVLSPDYPATTGSAPAMPQRMVDYLGTAGYGPEAEEIGRAS